MPPASFAATSAVLGGSLWLLHWLVRPGGDPLGQTLHWGGLAFVLLAASVAATGLVTGSVAALRLLVTAAVPLLVWSVVEFFRPAGASWYYGGWGLVALVAGAWGLWRDRDALVPAPRSSRGAHAR